MSGLSFESVERIRACLVCVRPQEPFPASSYKGAVFQLGGTTEVAESILSVYSPHLGRELGRLPAADPGTFWDLGRPIYLARGPIEAQTFDILAIEGQTQDADKNLVKIAASDALARIFDLGTDGPRVYFDGVTVSPIPLPAEGAWPHRRLFQLRTASNLRKALAFLDAS